MAENLADINQSNNSKANSDSEVVGRFRASPLTLTVFKRTNDNGEFYSYQLQRTYPKDDNGENFGYTTSLRPRDLRKAARLFEAAADKVDGLEYDPAD